MRSAKIKLQLDKQFTSHTWTNPVVPGDHPDPTIVRVGEDFYASATSGEWSPQFPLFHSTDLRDWRPIGAIFPVQPGWAEGSFWAPELVHDELSGRFLAWYVGRARGGPLSIAVASAPAVAGPYTDHGPIIAQPDGSIDPCFARDEHGAPYLIWKEDGNSAGRPTPIWAQPLSDDLLHLTGTATELIRNDQPWEEGVVEGPYILRRLDADGVRRFYLFYAGNSCCGQECKYAEGVARAEKLLGPWEKCPTNPIIGANDRWRCPGHGTAVHTDATPGKPAEDYLLYHAYPAGGSIYIGREAILDQIDWPASVAAGEKPGWPSVNSGTGPGEPGPAPLIDFADAFTQPTLGPAWQWPVNTAPGILTGDGRLRLTIPYDSPAFAPAAPGRPVESAMIAVPRPISAHYTAQVTLLVPPVPDPLLWAGLSVVGDPFNTIGLGLRGSDLILWERRGATQRDIARAAVAAGATQVILQATSYGREHHLHFTYSIDGRNFLKLGDAYDATDLPAWDRGLRLGLMLEGPRDHEAVFSGFSLKAKA